MAQKIKGITIEIGGDTTKLDKALGEVNSKTRQLQSELKGVNSLLKMDPKNVTLLKQKQDLLNQSIANTKEKLNTLKTAQIQVQEQFDKGQITEEQYRDFQREIVATENKLKSLTAELKNFGSVGAQQIAVVGQKMQDVGGKIESAGKKLSLFSAGSTVALTAVSKGAIDFETAFTGVTKTVDGTDEQLAKIKQGLLDLSKATSSSSTDIAAVAEAAGQLGVKTENILAFTETMVRLGDSTNMSADEAATAIAQLYNIMGSDINTVDQFGAAIVALGNNAATTEADIVNMASRIASSGTQVGLTEQEVLALSTTLASVGLEAEGGGSAISAVITKIDKDVALNTDSLKTWADVAGMSVKDFKTLWENDAMSAIQKVVGGMGDAKAGGENLNIILDELGVTSLRQTDTMKRLSGASELMADMVNISNNAWEENSALTNESSKRYETTAAKITQMKNTVTELCVKLGDILLPILNKIISAISKFTNWLTNLNPAAQKIVLVVLAIVSALGPFLIILAKLISSVGTIMTIVPKLVAIIKTVRTAFAAFNATLLANPIVLIVAAIAALIAGFVLLWNKCEWFRNFWIGLWENVKNVCKAVIDGIVGFFTGIIDFIKNNWQGLLLFIVNPFAGAFKLLYDNCEGFRNFVDGIIQKVKEIFASIVSFISTNVIEPIKQFFAPIVAWFTNLFMSIYTSLVSIINVIWGIIQGLWEMIVALFTAAINWINESIITPIKTAFTAAIEAIKTAIQVAWEFIKNIFITIATWVNDNVLVPIMNLLTSVWSWIQNNIIMPIKNAFTAAWNTLKTGAVNAWEGIKNVFSSVASFFGNIFSTAWQKVRNVFSAGGKIFAGIKDSIASVFTTVVNRIIGGINTVVAVPFNAINKALNKIRNISFLNISPFKDKWGENPLKVPQIPLLRTGGSIIGDGEAIMAEAGSPEMITMMNGKAIVRPLTSTDRKEVMSSTNNSGNNTFNFYSPEALTPSEERRKWRQEVQYQKLIHG
jgi:TP901 family phage tail tape measure protein|nr:MAG TPA: minor tail protein [Caudoviricetes sp.]